MKIRGNAVGTPIKPEKAVVKCSNLSEDEKAIARKNIGAAKEGEEGAAIDDTSTSATTTWSSEKISDYIEETFLGGAW